MDDLIESREKITKELALKMEELYANKCELMKNCSQCTYNGCSETLPNFTCIDRYENIDCLDCYDKGRMLSPNFSTVKLAEEVSTYDSEI